MLEMAQDMLKLLQDRFRSTLRVVADLAESMGVPPTVTALFGGRERAENTDDWSASRSSFSAPPVTQHAPAGNAAPAAPLVADAVTDEFVPLHEDDDEAPAEPAERKRPTGKRRGLMGAVDLSEKIRPLEVDDEVRGSTYLARILWCLGVAELEGTGALRPADMARMIMSRSPVSLEPPNVARYIRRSKPTCLVVDRAEGSSSFYRLNDEGRGIFNEMFRIKK